MTEKIVKAYSSLTPAKRLMLGLIIFVLAVVGWVAAATAASGILFTTPVPGDGEIIENTRPDISVSISVYEGTVSETDISMLLDGAAVTPGLSEGSTPGSYNISYTPPADLSEGSHTVQASVYDDTAGLQSTNWSFAVDNAPNPGSWSPGRNSSVTVSNPAVSLYVTDLFDNLDEASVSAVLNGQPVTPEFKFKGHWETVTYGDSCSSWTETVWVVDSYREGTVSFATSGLADGTHTVEIGIADVKGNLMTESWSFTVGVPPEISSLSPADNSSLGVIDRVSATVSDTNAIDWDSVILQINGSTVAHTVYTPTGTVYYEGSFPSGSYEVSLKVSDAAGNTAARMWSFQTDTLPPAPVVWEPDKGSTVNGNSPAVSLYVRDSANNLDKNSVTAKIDGAPVPAAFQYKGHWESDSCGATWYVVDSYKEGTVSFGTSGLNDGVHTAEVTIADSVGNMLKETWNFTVGTKPGFTNFNPAPNSVVGDTAFASVNVSDANNNIDPAAIVVYHNGSLVPHIYDPAAGTVTYNHNFGYGSHTIDVSAADTVYNTGTASWTFSIDNRPPGAALTGEFYDGMIISNGMLKFRGELTDFSDIKGTGSTPEVTLKLDGQVLPAQIRYEGMADSCGSYIITSRKTVYVTYEGTIKDGPHTLSLTSEDVLGNSGTTAWNFTGRTYPVISGWQPVTYLTDLTPLISAKVTDNDGVHRDAITMKVNGRKVSHSFDSASGLVSHVPAEPLADEAYHTVSLSAYDPGGLTTSISWMFNTSTYPEMPDSNMVNCSACHDIAEGSGIPFQSLHNTINFYGTHSSNDCDACHNYITYPADCVQCHGLEDGTPEAPHGSSPSISYQLRGYSSTYPVRVTANREIWDCIICHQPGSPLTGWYNGYVNPTRPLNNHDIPELHKTDRNNCNTCHALALTREHARPGRTDSERVQVSCNTCHLSPDARVRGAISAADKTCGACHTYTPHDTLEASRLIHGTALEDDCRTCHNPDIDEEHTANIRTKTATGRNYTCEVCHGSTDTVVQDAVYSGDTGCTACHPADYHDMALLHSSIYTDPVLFNCSQCHLNRLDTEHGGRISSVTGQPLDCVSCHLSNRADVKAAVSGSQTDCNACHEFHTDVTAAHDSGFVISPVVNCAQCHDDVLNTEHEGRGFTCNTCHDTVNETVYGAITGNINNCDACHGIHTPESVELPHTTANYVYAPTFECSGCHVNVLTTEHSPAGDCNLCHASSVQQISDSILGGRNDCDSCHYIHSDVAAAHISNYVTTPVVDCSGCHNDMLDIEHQAQGLDCAACHDSTNTTVAEAIYSSNTQCDACHGIHTLSSVEPAHTTADFVYNKTFDCSGCHSGVLTTEHQGKGDCNLCHSSATDQVTRSVAAGSTGCDSCHSVHQDVSSAHVTNMSANCTLCHSSSLTANHNENCATCHDSSRPDVIDAVAANNTACSACHQIHPDVSHESDFVKNKEIDCSWCHSKKLDGEHQKRGYSCRICHQTDVSKVNFAVNTQNRYCDACHNVHDDITEVHESVFPDILTVNCSGCHSRVISDEHVDRVNSDGEEMTCKTCHDDDSPDDVRKAVKNNDTSCVSCHDSIHGDVTPKHTAEFRNAGFACAGCHKVSLDQEHKRQDRGCNTCHESSNRTVITVIREKRTECNSCHIEHGNAIQAHWEFDLTKVQCRECHTVHREPAWQKQDKGKEVAL